ncbi:MAG: bifunctional alpha,alpha-trehalose-phosphate synthase (UDP-forming)/trehalose-phosphatase [Candidatus Aenigmarchaeota archaeon]|nr:bifunctional alpha,alpha-trehalose-phosphate synthase (UDP-forming)/trehalose-phosphatase [Candidatus Aenigmarchaeota archaeon]
MRLLIVSNRLPITVLKKNGDLKFQKSVGGLASGLKAFLDAGMPSSGATGYLWVGWPGVSVEGKAKEKLKDMLARHYAYPVFLSQKEMDKFYNGFCNKTIWPLFHYFPSYAVYEEEYWKHYRRVNEAFCDAVMEVAKPGDLIWVHDYHLMLLPKLLRKRLDGAMIGFFLHIPFPSFEIFRQLPKEWRNSMLEGLLGADLIGFHTHDYTQDFLRCVLRLLGHENNMGQIFTEERTLKADTFPMGIDFQKFHTMAADPKVRRHMDSLKKRLEDSRTILSIDRLDYTKGVINRLQGYEIFLDRNPQWHKKVAMILIVVPSRPGVEHYQQMKRQIDELVGRINGKFSSIGWTPILYQSKFLPFASLAALYSISDVALVTPLRDGMNLIAKEYVASRPDMTGTLVLSYMTGAAKELGEAIRVNPNHREDIADAIKEALEMTHEEQVRRNRIMQDRLRRYDVHRWAGDFIKDLHAVKKVQEKFNARLLNPAIRERLITDYSKARRRLILLDYDGTLVPFADHYQNSLPGEDVKGLLRLISGNPKTDVVLISGRDRNTLKEWFSGLDIGFVAEHGIWIRERGSEWNLAKALANDWKSGVLPILETFVDRLPGSFVEEKEYSIVFHYRKADPELGSVRAKDLMDTLLNFTANMDVQTLQGNKVIEIRSAGVNKGTAAGHFLSKGSYDFILAIGDDITDEDLFRILPETAYSIRVGIANTHARCSLYSQKDAIELLDEIGQKSQKNGKRFHERADTYITP